jgi:hypothetical protein
MKDFKYLIVLFLWVLFITFASSSAKSARLMAQDVTCPLGSTCVAKMGVTVTLQYNCGATQSSDDWYCRNRGACCTLDKPWNIEPGPKGETYINIREGEYNVE